MLTRIRQFFQKNRQSFDSLSDPVWRPYYNEQSLSAIGNRRLTSLGVLSLALRLYSDALVRFPLKLKDSSGKEIKNRYLKTLLENLTSFKQKRCFSVSLLAMFFCKETSIVKKKWIGEPEK